MSSASDPHPGTPRRGIAPTLALGCISLWGKGCPSIALPHAIPGESHFGRIMPQRGQVVHRMIPRGPISYSFQYTLDDAWIFYRLTR